MKHDIRWFAAILSLAATSLFAQEAPRAVETVTASSTTTVIEDADDPRALRLSLDGAIETTAERNLGVRLDRYEFEMAAQNARGAHGIFDWFTNATIQTQSQQQPVASAIFASQSKQTIANFGVSQLIPTGGTYSIGFNNSRSSSNNEFAFINPSYFSSLGFELSHPLLRDFGTDVTRRGIRIARNTLGINEEAFRNSLTLAVLGVEQAYYDLIFARQNLEVKHQSLALARDQERITQIRIDVGASAPLDILQPRVAVATREEEVILAEAQVRNAEDRLRQLMNLDPADWDRPIIPTDGVTHEPVVVDVEASVERALELRPELRQARLGIDTTRIQYVYARNQRLPRLDLNVNYGFAGLAGRQLVTDPVTGEPIGVIDRDFGEAFDQLIGFDFNSWTVGVNVGIPVTNIGARAEAKRAQLDLQQAEVTEEQLRQNITVDVRQAARNIETASRQIAATRAAREAAEKNLDAERKRFENGMTTNFQVLQIQQDLSDARSREIAAQVAYRKAVADYHRAVGDLLQAHDIRLTDSEAAAHPSRLDSIRWLNFGNYLK